MAYSSPIWAGQTRRGDGIGQSFSCQRGRSGILMSLVLTHNLRGTMAIPNRTDSPRHEGLSCRAHSLGVATSPALRPRVHVLPDFDIKGVVGIKIPACLPPGGPIRNSGQYRERSRWLDQPVAPRPDRPDHSLRRLLPNAYPDKGRQPVCLHRAGFLPRPRRCYDLHG